MTVAYFSMEFGLDESLATYAGGLGVLAGDFLKAAHDLGHPVVGVGLRYSQGYTHQRIDQDLQPVDEWREQPTTGLVDAGVRVVVRVGTREVRCRVWRVAEMPIPPLYLLEPLDPADRWITRRLYDPDCRIAQEMLLGIGGVRVLRALDPDVRLFHFNEGHAVFAGVELIAVAMERGLGFEEAWRAAQARIVFTTHTPVPAGNEVHALADVLRLGAGCELTASELARLGGDPFNMTVAGLRLARRANAVSALHAVTARAMWAGVEGAAPIVAVTNGVHVGTWQDRRIAAAGDDAALRAARLALKTDLVGEVERRIRVRLDPRVLTIGVARRAATYKRPDLILRDPERLAALLKDRRLQIVFSGKAHPADQEGKAMVTRLLRTIRQWPESIVFLEDYDMALARRLTRGCDVWLNNPVPPLEASGTSGMKAALNGVLNLSILDGWWPEGCEHGVTGWAIDGPGAAGRAAGAETAADRDARDLRTLFTVLEGEVLPAYADPTRWTAMMRASIRMATERFSAERMVRDYFARLYADGAGGGP